MRVCVCHMTLPIRMTFRNQAIRVMQVKFRKVYLKQKQFDFDLHTWHGHKEYSNSDNYLWIT